MIRSGDFLTPMKPDLGVFPIHFDVPEKAIKTSTLLTAMKSTTSIIEVVSNELISPAPKLEFYISPPEEGGWKANIFYAVATLGSSIWIEVGDQAIYDFFGVDPNAREITSEVTDFMKDATKKILETPNVEIEECLPDNQFLDRIITSKSSLMRQCQRDRSRYFRYRFY